MLISRRSAILGSGAALLAAQARLASASLLSENWGLLRPRFARHWAGGAIANGVDTGNGKLGLRLSVDLEVQDDMQFEGLLRISSKWPEATYNATYGIQGYCWGSGTDLGIEIGNTWLKYGDSLPSGLFWQGLLGRLELYHETGTEDHWILRGTLTGSRDGLRFDTQLSDHG